jgi:hypothetical protein
MRRAAAADHWGMPPKRLVRALLLLALGIVLATVAFSIDIDVEAAGITPSSSAVEEALALSRAASRDGGSDAATSVVALLHDATERGRKDGAALLLRELPVRTANAEAATARARARVAAVRVTTRTGAACRRAVLDLVSRQHALFVVLDGGLASDPDVWTAVERYAVGARALRRWWTLQAGRCSALADPAERAAVRRTLLDL